MKKIGIIAPSGCVENFNGDIVKKFFEKFEIDVKIFNSCISKFRYMAGDDNLRADDINSAFADKTLDAIICARGGYGAIRLLDKIDFDLVSKNKKPFVGFSDITILLMAFYKFSNLQSFHAPMVVNGILNMNDDEFLQYKNDILNPFYKTKFKNAVLWGGNLASIVSTFGAYDLIPDDDIILFIEDINEPDYKIDRMLNQILLNKKLSSKIKGVIFGDFYGAGKYINEIKQEFIKKLSCPFEENLNISHNPKNQVIPFGIKL